MLLACASTDYAKSGWYALPRKQTQPHGYTEGEIIVTTGRICLFIWWSPWYKGLK